MIINTGQRTDIPAYYTEWFMNRIREGFVLVRNPFNPVMVSRYELNPKVVDCISFCSKNPAPILPYLPELKAKFKLYFHVTITPYGKDIEPHVPDKNEVMKSYIGLSKSIGLEAVSWRYDPVFITDKYDISFHKEKFAYMAEMLSGYTDNCVVSFIDLYEKTLRNFGGVRKVTEGEQNELAEHFANIGKKYGIKIRGCCEKQELSRFGWDMSGCATKRVLERALGETLESPAGEGKARPECSCLIGHDIGAYNSCGHGCLYCYANYDKKIVEENMKQHDPKSPLLIGHINPEDEIKQAKQVRYGHGQMKLELV